MAFTKNRNEGPVKKYDEHLFFCLSLRLRRCGKSYIQRVCALKEVPLGYAYFRALNTDKDIRRNLFNLFLYRP